MSADPEMVAQSRTDPLVTRVATPRWYFGQLRAQQRTLAHAAKFRLPLLVLAGDADPLADSAAAEAFYEKAGSTDKRFKRYPGFLHELLREKERQTVFADIMEWMRRRVGAA
jgi:alpha-beta hydrolase superfamily lysophospholipase